MFSFFACCCPFLSLLNKFQRQFKIILRNHNSILHRYKERCCFIIKSEKKNNPLAVTDSKRFNKNKIFINSLLLEVICIIILICKQSLICQLQMNILNKRNILFCNKNTLLSQCFRRVKVIFSYLGFHSRTFTNHKTAGERGGYLFNSSLPLTPLSQTFRYFAANYCRELTSAHS